MNRMTSLLVLVGGGLVLTAAGSLRAQTTTATPTAKLLTACYVPLTGTVYLVGEPNTPADCVGATHIKFHWTDGPPGWDHGVMQNLLSDSHTQYLLVNGSRALSGDLSAGGFRITGLADAQAPSDAVSSRQVIKRGDAAGGDLAGTYPDPRVVGLQTHPVAPDAPTIPGQVLTWNGTAWAPATPPTPALSSSENVPLTLVQRDAVGGFRAGPVTLTRLDVNGTALQSGLVVGGVTGGAIPATGPGDRLMWHAGKAAFRAGRVDGTQWDDANVGSRSTAMGQNTIASGTTSTAMGAATTASGLISTTMGFVTTASADFSTAMGYITTASGGRSTAMGAATTASGGGSTAMGQNTTASGLLSTAMGNNTTASGPLSTAMGQSTTAGGDNSTAMGSGTMASGATSTAMGSFTMASGARSTAMGQSTTASGDNSTAMGRLASTNLQAGAFVYGDASTNAVVTAMGPNEFVVRAAGGFRFRTAADLSTGCDLPSGSGTFSCTSSRDAKENFRDENGERVLAQIARVPVQSWNYKTQDPAIRHLGPTAQDFYAAFQLGEGETTISTVDADGINLLAVQALERRTREQAREIEALRAELAALRAEVAQRKQ